MLLTALDCLVLVKYAKKNSCFVYLYCFPLTCIPEAVKPVTNEQQDADNGAAKDASIFVNKEPIREDQVQNAVKFLSHPKVKGSPVMYRRSFLERDESPSVSTTQTAVANQACIKYSTTSTDSICATGTSCSWFQIGTAVVFKNAVVPRLKSWIRKVVNEDVEEDAANKTDKKPTLAEEAAAAAAKAAAAAAASDVARASQEMLIVYLLCIICQSNIQAREVQVTSSRPSSYTNGRADYDSRSARSLSPPPASVEPSANPPHPKSYMEIMSMIQRGERPPNIRVFRNFLLLIPLSLSLYIYM
ncbi:putative peroxisomal membrane protein [Helianthus anomalus]